MSVDFYSATEEDVKTWLDGDGEFLAPARILTDLTEEQATVVPPASPYSIAQVLAHMLYWQGKGLAKMRGKTWAEAQHLADTFAPPAPGTWNQLVSAFLSDLEAIKKIAEEKAEYGYVGRALHNGYHLGQIVLLRQMLGCWPPVGGEDYDF